MSDDEQQQSMAQQDEVKTEENATINIKVRG